MGGEGRGHDLPRASLLPLLALVLASGCVIHKDLLDGATSEGASTGDDPGGSTQPTTGEPQGGESTGAPGTTTGEGTTGGATTTDVTTTGDTGGPVQSELIVFDADGPLCMPVCARDKDPMTAVLDENCAMFLVDGGQATAAIVRCAQVGDEWLIPAGTVICYQTLIDRGGETPSTIPIATAMRFLSTPPNSVPITSVFTNERR